MRVGLVIYGSMETLSGGYLYDRSLVAHLRQAGDQVTLISLPWRSYPLHLGQNFSPQMARRLLNLRIDVLLQDELNHPSLFLLNRLVRRSVDYPIVSIVHHLRSSEQHSAGLRWLYRLVERDYLRGVQGFVFNSRTTQAEVQQLSGLPAQGLVAYPGGDQFGDGLEESAILARTAQPGPLRLLFVGNLIERKGLHTLLAALARLPAKEWVLDIVGRADVDRAYAARMAAYVRQHGLTDQVRFFGRLSDDDLRQVWLASQMLVVPSQYEGFGIVYLEGLSFGLPAIASTAGAAGEIIRAKQEGFLIPPDDVPALAEPLAALIADRTCLARMSIAARRRFAAFPTWQETTASIRAHLRNLIG